MLIDWFTVAAQAVNFIVLVWLLQHFLYKPILTAIDAREHKISTALADAAARQTEAVTARDDMAGKLKTFDDERAARWSQVILELQKQRAGLFDTARAEAADLVDKQRASLRADATSLTDQMARLATAEVFSIAGKALRELASVGLEERMCGVFAQRLRQMSQESKAAFAAALGQSAMNAVVRSRFAMAEQEQAALRNAVNETFSADVHLEFETVAMGDDGIDLSAGGQRLAWGIQEYIKAFQEKARALMMPQPAPARAAVPAPPPAAPSPVAQAPIAVAPARAKAS